jgi:TolA-binding protein
LNDVGKDEMLSDRYGNALVLFQRGYSLFPSAKVLVNLATAQVQLGHCDDARRTARQVIALWPQHLAAPRAQKLIRVCDEWEAQHRAP